MTYKDLLLRLSAMSNEELEMTATVWVSDFDEFWPVRYVLENPEADVLDKGHPYMGV
jgi:hypothetical protein